MKASGFVWTVSEPLVLPFGHVDVANDPSHTRSRRTGHALSVERVSSVAAVPPYRGRIAVHIQNASLLYHRQVTILDICIARSLLEIGSNLTALIGSSVVFYILGTVDVPRDLPMFYVGYFFMAWCAVAITLIIGALSERTDWVQQIWLPCSYMYMMFRGSSALQTGCRRAFAPWRFISPIHRHR